MSLLICLIFYFASSHTHIHYVAFSYLEIDFIIFNFLHTFKLFFNVFHVIQFISIKWSTKFNFSFQKWLFHGDRGVYWKTWDFYGQNSTEIFAKISVIFFLLFWWFWILNPPLALIRCYHKHSFFSLSLQEWDSSGWLCSLKYYNLMFSCLKSTMI